MPLEPSLHLRVLVGSIVVGDEVQIVESRPLSRDKRWVVESVVKREIRTADTGVADLKVEG